MHDILRTARADRRSAGYRYDQLITRLHDLRDNIMMLVYLCVCVCVSVSVAMTTDDVDDDE